MKYFLIHGSYGNPNENWFPWLKDYLESMGHQVITPIFQTPNNQSLESWTEEFKKYESQIDEDTIFIGHSLGPSFILSILEKINVKVKGCIFVAGFLGLLNNKDFDEINHTFTNREFNWEKILENCDNFYVLNSKDDPYVPLEKGYELSRYLKTELQVFETAGHFNLDSGYDKFEDLVKYVYLIENQISFRVENIHGLIAQPENSNNTAVIMVAGFGVTGINKSLFVDNSHYLSKKGFNCFTFDFSGRGRSEGDYSKVSIETQMRDLQIVINFVKEKYKDYAIIAQSFGNSSTIALQHDAKALILMGSFAKPKKDLSKIFTELDFKGYSKRISSQGEEFIIGPKYWSDFEKFDLKELISKLKIPVLFIHGEKDTNILESSARELFNSVSSTKRFVKIKDSSHDLLINRTLQIDATIHWLNNFLLGKEFLIEKSFSIIIFCDENNNVLLQERKAISKIGEEWGFFGGKIENLESPEEALKREVKEELVYDLKSEFEFIGSVDIKSKSKLKTKEYVFVSKLGDKLGSFTQREGDQMKLFSIDEARKLKMYDSKDKVLNVVETYLKSNNSK